MINANLNYTALDKQTKFTAHDFTPEQLSTAGLDKFVRAQTAFQVAFYVLAGFFAVGLAVNLTAMIQGSEIIWAALLAQIIWAAIFVAIGFILPRRMLNSKFKVLKFALDNNLKFDARSHTASSEPLLFRLGHSQKVSDILTWPSGENCLGNFRYTVGSGKNQHTYHLKFATLKLPRRLPHLLLNSKNNNFASDVSGFKVEKLKLEGDFAKTFTLYAPPSHRIDALQVFTPDVMAALLDHGARYDYEILDDRLYIYSPNFALGKEEAMKTFLESTTRLAAELSHQAKNYKDTSAQTFAENTVNESGARLQRKGWSRQVWIIIIAVVLFILYNVFMIIRTFNT